MVAASSRRPPRRATPPRNRWPAPARTALRSSWRPDP